MLKKKIVLCSRDTDPGGLYPNPTSEKKPDLTFDKKNGSDFDLIITSTIYFFLSTKKSI